MVLPEGQGPAFSPTVTVRAPGCVHLIGGHAGYAALPVLAIATGQALVVDVVPLDQPVFEATSARFPGAVRVVRGTPHHGAPWGRHIAAAAAALEGVQPSRGARLHISGDLPAEAGLASSAALTTGVLAAVLAAWDVPVDRDDLVARAARAGHATGAETAGADEEVIVFAEAGHAMRIDFPPPARRQAPLPPGLHFVIARAAEPPADGDPRDAFNERVLGARLAAAMLCDMIGAESSRPPRLADVIGFPESELLVEELPPRMAPSGVARSTGLPLAMLSGASAAMDDRALYTVRPYARHLLGEASRVDDAEAALGRADLAAFGRVLDASHRSLRDDFGCSTPALDSLCDAMRLAGALGARLVNEGAGGFVLAAVQSASLAAVLEAAAAAGSGEAFELTASAGLSIRRP